MGHKRMFMFLFGFLFIFSSAAIAQHPIVTAEQVKSRVEGKKKVVVIDSRTPEEYQEGHIPGAVNIPPDQMKTETARLPKDRKTPMIFYCRGVG
jgi:rhodanese-related sulfurtransferase